MVAGSLFKIAMVSLGIVLGISFKDIATKQSKPFLDFLSHPRYLHNLYLVETVNSNTFHTRTSFVIQFLL